MIIRNATMADVEGMHELFTHYAEKGLMLARSRSTLYENIRDFVVVEKDNKVIGAGGLHVIWENLAEIRSLAVYEDCLKQGVGIKIVETLLQEAKQLGIGKIFSLTYQPGFFQKCNFEIVDKNTLDHKVWKECINCPKFPNCDETAVVIHL